MHGCVSHPEDVVLTRQHYLRYEDRNAALAGIVQALLITKHMLFVGFSLQDDNFHRVIDAVRKALVHQDKGHRQSVQNYGTCLFLIQNALMDELWAKELDMVSMEPYIKDPKGADWGRTARKKEIFIDYLACHTSTVTSHILDFKLDYMLSKSELAFRDHVVKFIENIPPEVKSVSPAWGTLIKTLKTQFGYEPADEPNRFNN